MKKSLQDYLLLVEKEFEYKLKIASEITESQFDAMETLLQKYDLIDVKSINRLPIQNNPLDFTNLKPTEVFVIDLVTRLPLPVSNFADQIARCTDINIKRIIIRGKNDPYEKELQNIELKAETDYVTKIDDPEYKSDGIETQDSYGTEYNQDMVGEILATREDKPKFNKKEFDSKFKKAFNDFKHSKSVLQDIKDGPEL